MHNSGLSVPGAPCILSRSGLYVPAGAGSSPTAPVNTFAPVISGTTTEGQTLSTTTGTWTGSPTPTYAYQWKRDGVNIGAATSNTYLLVTADVGAAITVTVTATNTAGSAGATSAGVGPVAALPSAPVNTVAPVISGTPVENFTLTSSTGTWTGSPIPTYAYQWKRDGVNISAATSSTYLVVTADVGTTTTVTVTATNGSGSASATSSGVGPIAPVTYDTDALALFAQMTNQPTAPEKQAISDFYAGLKADGIYTALDEMWGLGCGADAQQAALRWKNPTSTPITPVNSPVFTAYRGWQPDGVSSYLNLNYDLSTQSVSYTQNANALGFYYNVRAPIAFNIAMGVTDGTFAATFIRPREDANGGVNLRNNNLSTASLTVINAAATGLISAVRTSSTAVAVYVNGVQKATQTTTATTGIPAGSVYFGAHNSSGTANTFRADRPAFIFSGNLTGPQNLALYNRVLTLLSYFGAN